MRNNRKIPVLGLWWGTGEIFTRNQAAFCRGLWLDWANSCWSYRSSQKERRITGSATELFSLGKQWEIIPHLPGKEYGEQEVKVRALFLVRQFYVGEFYNWKKKMNFWILKRQLGYRLSIKKSTMRNVLIILEESIQSEYEHNQSSFSWSFLDTLSVRQRFWGVHEDTYMYLHAISVWQSY